MDEHPLLWDQRISIWHWSRPVESHHETGQIWEMVTNHFPSNWVSSFCFAWFICCCSFGSNLCRSLMQDKSMLMRIPVLRAILAFEFHEWRPRSRKVWKKNFYRLIEGIKFQSIYPQIKNWQKIKLNEIKFSVSHTRIKSEQNSIASRSSDCNSRICNIPP